MKLLPNLIITHIIVLCDFFFFLNSREWINMSNDTHVENDIQNVSD